MRKFGGYNLDSLLEEKAIRFYAMVEYSLRLDAEYIQELITVAAFPYMEEADRADVLANYANVSRDMITYKEDLDDYSGLERLKRVL